jgi:hypothetical protein
MQEYQTIKTAEDFYYVSPMTNRGVQKGQKLEEKKELLSATDDSPSPSRIDDTPTEKKTSKFDKDSLKINISNQLFDMPVDLEIITPHHRSITALDDIDSGNSQSKRRLQPSPSIHIIDIEGFKTGTKNGIQNLKSTDGFLFEDFKKDKSPIYDVKDL